VKVYSEAMRKQAQKKLLMWISCNYPSLGLLSPLLIKTYQP
jgi:hypothetical protein